MTAEEKNIVGVNPCQINSQHLLTLSTRCNCAPSIARKQIYTKLSLRRYNS